jgi:hypothetical protein
MTNHEDNRVLNRIGARDLTAGETERVSGGRRGTTTVCTFNEATKTRDGDPGECS